jgi:hypothetical protein
VSCLTRRRVCITPRECVVRAREGPAFVACSVASQQDWVPVRRDEAFAADVQRLRGAPRVAWAPSLIARCQMTSAGQRSTARASPNWCLARSRIGCGRPMAVLETMAAHAAPFAGGGARDGGRERTGPQTQSECTAQRGVRLRNASLKMSARNKPGKLTALDSPAFQER